MTTITHTEMARNVARDTGWNLDIEASEREWAAVGIGPVGQHRDSESLDRSNFAVITAKLREEFGEAADIARFRHWAVGWIEEVIWDAGRGVAIRANGNAELCSDGRFVCAIPHLHASQYPSGRELTAQQRKRAQDVIASMLADWVATHAGDIAQADDIDRNNAALSLEEDIARHEAALTILRAELAACEEGEPFTQYPDLPTKRR